MTENYVSSIPLVTNYINSILLKLETGGVDLQNCYVDHFCIRIPWGEKGDGDFSNYLTAKKNFGDMGTLISEEIIPMNENGRPIAIFKLKSPVGCKLNDIDLIEIPAPRFGKVENEGPTHIEIVTPGGIPLEKFISLNHTALEKIVSNENLVNAIKDEKSGVLNAELEIDFGNNQKVKFHTRSIETIVLEEQTKKIDNLKVLKSKFESKYPGIIG